MKGVLIKGIEMPMDCNGCPCFGQSYMGDETDYCQVVVRWFKDEDFPEGENTGSTRAKWCPLVEADSTWFSHHPQGNIYSKLP